MAARQPNLSTGNRGVEVLLMQGRVHTYEGHSMQQVVLPVRALVAAGCQTVVLTNAAGGVGEGLAAGDLVLIRDHPEPDGRFAAARSK